MSRLTALNWGHGNVSNTAVVSPCVLHLATHGFFLTDEEFKQTNAGAGLLAGPFGTGTTFGSPRNGGTRWNASLPESEWENPMVRCGIALAGANQFSNSALRIPQ